MDELETYLKTTEEEANTLLNSLYGNPKTELSKAANHLLFSGGKRLRPALFKLAVDAVNPNSSKKLMAAGLALEVTHNFTLIHDDIMDRDEFRRGKPTVHAVWGEPTAILAGDVLYARAFALISTVDAPADKRAKATNMLAVTCEDICEGQNLDMSFEKREDVTTEEFMRMINGKTGVLYGAAASIGALLAGADDKVASAFYDYGCKIGAAFQIQDDLIDLTVTSDKSGKDQASDIREGKQTLIAIKAREHGIDLKPYRRALSPDEIDALIKLLEEKNVLSDVRSIAAGMIEQAVSGLSMLAESKEKKLLGDLAKFFIERSF